MCRLFATSSCCADTSVVSACNDLSNHVSARDSEAPLLGYIYNNDADVVSASPSVLLIAPPNTVIRCAGNNPSGLAIAAK